MCMYVLCVLCLICMCTTIFNINYLNMTGIIKTFINLHTAISMQMFDTMNITRHVALYFLLISAANVQEFKCF